MGKKRVEEAGGVKEDGAMEMESRRLRELACSRGLLAGKKAAPEKPLQAKFGIKRCDGKDICKKGHRKNKYLFSFPGLVAPVAGGRFGELAHLDSRNPLLYVEFPQGRLKLFGTIVYPKNKYITMNFVRGAGNIQCEDLFESMVVFPEAWWIGTKEENPDELRLEMPVDLQQKQEKHAKYDFAGGAGEPRGDVDVFSSPPEPVLAMHMEPIKLAAPKGQLKMDLWLSQNKLPEKKSSPSEANEKRKFSSEWQSEEDDSGFDDLEDAPTPARQSARSAGKKYSYAESSSEENGVDGSGGIDDSDAETGGENINKLYGSMDADDSHLVRESQTSKKDVADMAITIDGDDAEETSIMDQLATSQTPSRKSTAGGVLLSTPVPASAGSKQSSLATFFMKSSEKKNGVNVEAAVSVVEMDRFQSSPTTELLPYTHSESNGSKRKRISPLQGKQTPKEGEEKNKPAANRRNTTIENAIEVSDDSDAD